MDSLVVLELHIWNEVKIVHACFWRLERICPMPLSLFLEYHNLCYSVVSLVSASISHSYTVLLPRITSVWPFSILIVSAKTQKPHWQVTRVRASTYIFVESNLQYLMELKHKWVLLKKPMLCAPRMGSGGALVGKVTVTFYFSFLRACSFRVCPWLRVPTIEAASFWLWLFGDWHVT